MGGGQQQVEGQTGDGEGEGEGGQCWDEEEGEGIQVTDAAAAAAATVVSVNETRIVRERRFCDILDDVSDDDGMSLGNELSDYENPDSPTRGNWNGFTFRGQ